MSYLRTSFEEIISNYKRQNLLKAFTHYIEKKVLLMYNIRILIGRLYMKEIDYINSNKSNKNKIKDFFSFKKPLLKNFWFYFITIFSTIFLIFVIPILINESYKYNSGYITLWNAADVLSYYAVILTGVISVSILAITILVTKKQTDKQIKHQLSQSQFPFFQIDWIRTNNNSHFKKHQDQTWHYILKLDNNGELINTNESIIDIYLNNIGNSIALETNYEISMFASKLILDYAINKQEGILIQYDVGKNLKDVFVRQHIMKCKDLKIEHSATFSTYVSVNFKNIWGIELKQMIQIDLEFHPIKKEIKVIIFPASCFKLAEK